MRYFIFDTLEESQAANGKIFSQISTDYLGRGGKSDAQGLIGKKDGLDNPNAARATSWDIPMQRVDKKWILLHPENYLQTKKPGQHGLIAKMLKNLNSVPVEEYSDDWLADLVGEIADKPGNPGKAKGLIKE